MLSLPRSGRWLLPGLLCALGAGSRPTAQVLASGFQAEAIASGWNNPVGLCFLDPQRLLVAERDGRVWYVEGDQRKNLVYDIAGETLINGDRGMLGLAVPADFDDSGWLYLLFVVDVQGGDGANLAFSRLIRIQTRYETDGRLIARPETREVLLGSSWSTGIPSCHLSHTIGSLRFLSDGSLVLTTGDNAHYDSTDAGGRDPACFAAGRTPADQDVGAYRSQYDNTLCGKVLRLDPATGHGYADNPFYTGDPEALLSRIWARGLRNPFRFTLVPGTGPREALYLSDVGWDTWEELNLCLGGENFGWPCYEGTGRLNAYQSADTRGFCATASAQHTPPLLSWHHNQGINGFRGNCATGLCVYTGDRYPELYRGRLFFCDYGRDWMRAGRLSPGLSIENSIAFGSSMGGVVDLVAQPGSGDLVYATLGGVFRLRYLGTGRLPEAVATASPAFGPGDLLVRLSAAGSSDPENQELSFAWDLGNGASAAGPEAEATYTGSANYVARVTVTDTEGLSDSTEVLLTPHNTPPAIDAWLGPVENARFVSDEPLACAALVHDDEEEAPLVSWTLDLVHGHHMHPNWAASTGPDALLFPASHGPGDNHFIVRLRVTDERGLWTEREREIFDQDSHPRAHLELQETRIRVGQTLAPVGHVDFSLGRVEDKQASLTWDWGDGTIDVVPEARHHVDSRPTHVYRRAGRFPLRLIAERLGAKDIAESEIVVASARPSVAIFAPLEQERWVARAEQQEIVAALTTGLAGRASEVRVFTFGGVKDLVPWMESLVADPLPDVLVLLDFVPDALVSGGWAGSLLDRWIAGKNGIVWSGTTPFLNTLGDDGQTALTVLAGEAFAGASGNGVVNGSGQQLLGPLAAAVVPSLTSYTAQRALRYDLLTSAWSVARIFAEDLDRDSDAIELVRGAGGFYAQFLCSSEAGLPRAAVLSEYLRDKLGGMRGQAAPPAAGARRRR